VLDPWIASFHYPYTNLPTAEGRTIFYRRIFVGLTLFSDFPGIEGSFWVGLLRRRLFPDCFSSVFFITLPFRSVDRIILEIFSLFLAVQFPEFPTLFNRPACRWSPSFPRLVRKINEIDIVSGALFLLPHLGLNEFLILFGR